MAENETDETEPPPKPPVAKLAMMQIMLIVGLVAVTQVSVMLLMELVRPANATAVAIADAEELVEEEVFVEEPEIDIEDLEDANYLPLDPALVVNLQGDGNSRFLQATVQLMTRDEDVFEAARTHSPAIRSALIMLFGTLEYESIATRKGKEALQDQARTVADEVLFDLAGIEGVDAVYLTSFVIQ